MKAVLLGIALLALGWAPAVSAEWQNTDNCAVEFIILGIAQDAGIPQIGHPDDPAWADDSLGRQATAAAIIDYPAGARYLFEATPDIRGQLQWLDQLAAPNSLPLGLNGIFLTHAHIGHYAGLMFAGHESAGTDGLAIYTMPRMKKYLQSQGPWDQLVRYGNVRLIPMDPMELVSLQSGTRVTPYPVPHRDEYSETVGFVIDGKDASVLFLPDIDNWDEWETAHRVRLEDILARVDYAYVDGTFYDNNELPGRDMTAIPHPRITDTIKRLRPLPAYERQKVRFIHLNHTNPARFPDGKEAEKIELAGFRLAREGERVCLTAAD